MSRGDFPSDGPTVDDACVPAVVEFGAGRGYLTQMLADCYGIKKVFLVERKSYKLKADRSLRQKDSLILERLRIDIEDLNLNGVESLQGIPYLATGKHLCGPATDMTLRSCLAKKCTQCNVAGHRAGCNLRGLAIATCCHHLCQWKHYINKRYLSNLGITRQDFHAITWFTSWAVDADHSSGLPGSVDVASDLQIMYQSFAKILLMPSSCISYDTAHHFSVLACSNIGFPAQEGNVGLAVEDVLREIKAVEIAVLGFMCKDVIDMGRLMWIKEHGLEAHLVKYVPYSISPENHLLIAKG
ncbi:hypothetical protein RHMOL_Rhmol13G0008100 [Rhododendron molle]|uniref:Uncharacterized protein n=1 Tax=Rhododendron molle TaxID=49168 RepID=A0ACC0L2Z0_RHOML|nr:hypothetical protein RHMOL_Rhmol13G0008100 [Rhododendron molle]